MELDHIPEKEPQAPPPSRERVVYSEILCIPPIREQFPPIYDNIKPSKPSVTIIPANVQDDDIPPPIPANVQDDDILPPIPANVQDDDILPPIPAHTDKTSDTTKQMSNDEEITGGLTSPSPASEIIVSQKGYHDDEEPLPGHVEEDSSDTII